MLYSLNVFHHPHAGLRSRKRSRSPSPSHIDAHYPLPKRTCCTPPPSPTIRYSLGEYNQAFAAYKLAEGLDQFANYDHWADCSGLSKDVNFSVEAEPEK